MTCDVLQISMLGLALSIRRAIKPSTSFFSAVSLRRFTYSKVVICLFTVNKMDSFIKVVLNNLLIYKTLVLSPELISDVTTRHF